MNLAQGESAQFPQRGGYLLPSWFLGIWGAVYPRAKVRDLTSVGQTQTENSGVDGVEKPLGLAPPWLLSPVSQPQENPAL